MSRLRHEAGQTVVLIAVLLPLFLGLGAIAVDIGYWYVVKKTAQDAADAAALAAAAELPVKSEAEAAAAIYVMANITDATWQVEYPYVPDAVGSNPPPYGVGPPAPPVGTPDPTKVEVIVERRADTFFGRIFGLSETAVVSRAVAERKPGSGNLAIFAHSYQSCDDGLEIDATGVRVEGHIHSNGQYDVHSGYGDDALEAVDGTIWRENCVSNLDPDQYGARYGPGPDHDFLPRDAWRMANWPLWHTPAASGWPSCSGSDFSGQRIEVLANAIRITDADSQRAVPHDGVLPAGTYCATESFAILASGLQGTITALAPRIAVEGSRLELTPHARGVLFFSVPNPDARSDNDGSIGRGGNPDCTPDPGHDLVLNGSDHEWAGVVFNPCGRVVLNTSDSRLEGAVVAKSVFLTGDRVTLTGTATLPSPVGLVE